MAVENFNIRLMQHGDWPSVRKMVTTVRGQVSTEFFEFSITQEENGTNIVAVDSNGSNLN